MTAAALLARDALCRCGAALELVDRHDQWVWVPADGSPVIVEHGLPDGFERSDDLLAWLRANNVDLYSNLAAALDLCCNPFIHRHAPGNYPEFPGPVPEHCGEPMWLRPSGWHCRNRGCGHQDTT